MEEAAPSWSSHTTALCHRGFTTGTNAAKQWCAAARRQILCLKAGQTSQHEEEPFERCFRHCTMQRHLLSFDMSTREATLSCSTSAERAFASPRLHRACPCCRDKVSTRQVMARVTNLVFLSRNTWHNSPRVTQELNGYKEKSCCHNNSTEKGNSLWVVLSLRLKETFISSLTVTIQRNYSCGCSCRMLLLPLKNGVIVPGCTTEG